MDKFNGLDRRVQINGQVGGFNAIGVDVAGCTQLNQRINKPIGKILWICGWVEVGSCIDTWPKLVRQLTNSSTNTRKIVKLCVDVCGYGYGCVNANVTDSVSAHGNGNVAGCVHEKFSAPIDKAKWLCYNGLTK